MSKPQKLVFATANMGKVRELRAMLGADFDVLLQSDFGIEPVDETGTTFTENALLKARHAAAVSGLPALADDSGIEVAALDGAPGVHSARYAGEAASDADNLQKLLQEMDSEQDRRARFRCVLAYVTSPDDEQPLIAEGSWEGALALSPVGTNGFGYDPIFIDPDSGVTSAELPPEVKNARSHRGKAFAALREQLLARR